MAKTAKTKTIFCPNTIFPRVIFAGSKRGFPYRWLAPSGQLKATGHKRGTADRANRAKEPTGPGWAQPTGQRGQPGQIGPTGPGC